MKVHYITCATSSAVDTKTRKLSLFHILDEIAAATFPLRLHNLCVASLLERDEDEDSLQNYNLAISLNGGLLASFAMQIDFQTLRRNRTVNTVTALTIPEPGTVLVSILQKNRVLAQWNMLAIQALPVPTEVKPTTASPIKEAPALAKTRPTIN